MENPTAMNFRTNKSSSKCLPKHVYINAPKESFTFMKSFLGLSHCNENDKLQLDQKPMMKLTQFYIYDEFFNMCHLTVGAIEDRHKLYANGYVKPLRNNNCSEDDGIAITNIGPINEWFISANNIMELENIIGIINSI